MSRARPGQGCVCFSNGGLGNLVRGSCMVASPLVVFAFDGVCASVVPLAAAAMPMPTTPTACRRERSGVSGFMRRSLGRSDRALAAATDADLRSPHPATREISRRLVDHEMEDGQYHQRGRAARE